MIKTLESGAIIDITICSFAEGTKLMKAVSKEIKEIQISLGNGQGMDIFKTQLGSEALNTIKNIVTGLISSEEIEAALWPCMKRGTYTLNGVKQNITPDLFEDEKAREDYIPILKEVLVYSLTPFLRSLKSLVKDIPAAGISIQK